MAQYLILIYENEADFVAGGEAAFGRVMQAHQAFGAKHAASLRA